MAHSWAQAVKNALVQNLQKTGYRQQRLQQQGHSKATHATDLVAFKALEPLIAQQPCQALIEGFEPISHPNPTFTVFIDPLDGSLNWDRGAGDPAFMLAILPRAQWQGACFKHLSFAYVQGLRSGNYYYSFGLNAWHYNALTQQLLPLQCGAITQLDQALLYLKTGYGGAERQFRYTWPLFFEAKDIRATDNAGTELCELAADAADAMVEARQLSDFYNLIPLPILQAAGAVVTNLKGQDLWHSALAPNQHYDFIAATSNPLHQQIWQRIQQFRKAKNHQTPFLQLTMKR